MTLWAGDDLAADIEWHVWFLSNQRRAWKHLPPLERSEELAAVARAHSADMLRRGYFDHHTPEGLGPADRLARHGVVLAGCSENLYAIRNGPVEAVDLAGRVVAGWMENAGHRANILSAEFRLVGVGVACHDRSLMVTQVFGA